MKQTLTFNELKQREGLPIWVEYWENRNYQDWFICGEYEWRQGWTTDWITIKGLGEFSKEQVDDGYILCYDKSPTHELTRR